MQAQSGHMTAPPVRALLTAGALTGEWVLDPRTSSIRLKSRSMWGLAPVNGVFREVSGNGTVTPSVPRRRSGATASNTPPRSAKSSPVASRFPRPSANATTANNSHPPTP